MKQLRTAFIFPVLLVLVLGALRATPTNPAAAIFQSPPGTSSLPPLSLAETPMPSSTPPPPATPLPPTPTPTVFGWSGLLEGLSSQWPLLGAGCAAVLLVMLALAAVLLFQRRQGRREPTRPLLPVPPSLPWLEATVAGRPHRWPLGKESLTVGRSSDNDLVITSEFVGWETVSRRHARLYRRGDDWIVEDLGSTNGIYVNGRRTRHNRLRDGWRLEVGGVAFIFRTGRGGAA